MGLGVTMKLHLVQQGMHTLAPVLVHQDGEFATPMTVHLVQQGMQSPTQCLGCQYMELDTVKKLHLARQGGQGRTQALVQQGWLMMMHHPLTGSSTMGLMPELTPKAQTW